MAQYGYFLSLALSGNLEDICIVDFIALSLFLHTGNIYFLVESSIKFATRKFLSSSFGAMPPNLTFM